nr:hypothetical protein GCM10020092_075820 [Actinoplanes digitatis]
MQFAVTDRAAIAFSRAFYIALAHGRGVDEAVHSGRVGILGTAGHTLEWLTPRAVPTGRQRTPVLHHRSPFRPPPPAPRPGRAGSPGGTGSRRSPHQGIA